MATKLIQAASLALMQLTSFAGIQNTSGDLQDPQAQINSLVEYLEGSLTDRCVGYGYAIYNGDNFVGGGGHGAREKSGNNYADYPYDENTQKDCHSMTKTISAFLMR